MMRMEDFRKMMQQQRAEETPELKEHHRRLEHRVDRYRITLAGPDPQVFDITQRSGKATTFRMIDEGITIADFPDELESADLVDEGAEHSWEENGHAMFYSWPQVATVEHWWWIDEDAAKVEDAIDPNAPSPYL